MLSSPDYIPELSLSQESLPVREKQLLEEVSVGSIGKGRILCGTGLFSICHHPPTDIHCIYLAVTHPLKGLLKFYRLHA